MNVHVVRGLARDALNQVLDNSVFRILAVLSLLPVLLTFVVGLREDHVALLFGLKTFTYDEIFGIFSDSGAAAFPDPQGLLIEGLLGVVFDFLAGSLGMLFALAATAFFVPRMLEKGAAEILFQRPVSRTTLYLSRYFAGLLFVACVAGLLVSGMFLGLYLVSGHSDPGILVAALELTYVFGLIHAFSMLAGVVTRSTVGALLLSALFFFSNGCIHNAWIAKESFRGVIARAQPVDPETGGQAAEDDPGSEERKSAPSRLKSFFVTTLDVLHLALPKTSDAAVLSKKLRERLERATFVDEVSGALLTQIPEGLSRREPGRSAADAATLGEPILRLEAEAPPCTVVLWRRPVERSETTIGERTRVRTESTTQAARSLIEGLQLEQAAAPERLSFGRTALGGELSGSLVTHADQGRALEALLYRGVDSKDMLTLLVRAEGPDAAALARTTRERVSQHLSLDSPTPDDWYSSQLRVDAPLRFNVLFSIGSSLLFALAMLALGAWRLARIDF